jgi:glycosyltransferase involved in cell wall biosynthesis
VLLTLVGEGPDRAALEKLIAERGLSGQVQLSGACNHDKVADFYRNSDAFILASFSEGVPVVLMEAMAMELPCIATWVMGIPELIDNGVDGLLVPPADPVALADAVDRLIKDPELTRRIGAAGRTKILSSYDLERNTESLSATFREYLSVGLNHSAPAKP